MRVLDVGSGIGGAAFHLARQYGSHVIGIDLAPEMLRIACDRAGEFRGPGKVEFRLGDVLTASFEQPFDLIWSRDALMHVHDKPRLFRRLFELTAPGGALIITDYSRNDEITHREFEAYIRSTGYHVVSPQEYGRLLESAGFHPVEVEDATTRFIDILRREVQRLAMSRTEFLSEFSESDLDYLIKRWEMKDEFCEEGAMKWGILLARRQS
jgi:phosphoethanolamine N-methyltransferase